jgi:NifU-like protein involved in Fe-S cluster formation
MALSQLYSDKILELAANAIQPARLAKPQASSRKVSRVCGSVVEVDVVVDKGVITAYGHTVSACALGQTSAAILAREVIGSNVAEVVSVAAEFRDMLKNGGAPPGGKWADLACLEPAREFPARHASTLLAFDAVCEAVEKATHEQTLSEIG